MAITLNWLLNQSPLDNLACVAGKGYTDHEVTSVSVMENPDVLLWFKKNELVLSTGYVFKDDPALQVQIIQNLKELDCAGLCLTTRRYFEHFPQNMVEEAEAVGLPLIEIPYRYTFAAVSRAVTDELHRQAREIAGLEQDIFSGISDAYFERRGIDEMLQILSNAIHRTAMITNLNYQVETCAMPPKYRRLFEQTRGQISLSVDAANMEQQNGAYKNFDLNGEHIRFQTHLLPNRNGYLCTACASYDLGPVCQSIVEKSLPVFALEYDRIHVGDKSIRGYFDFFFDFLMNDSRKTEEEIKVLCNLYGFDYSKKRVCLTIKASNSNPEQLRAINDHVAELLHAEQKKFFLCSHQDFICIFLYYEPSVRNILAVTDCTKTAGFLYEELEERFPHCTRIGIGRCHKRPVTISASFRDSLRALQLLEVLHDGETGISSYFEQIPYHVLCNLETVELQKLYRDSVYILAEFDQENNTQLVATLKMYFQCKFNLSETAKQLYLHRNTLSYRLDKIKELLNMDFDSPNELFSLYLGICAMELLDKSVSS